MRLFIPRTVSSIGVRGSATWHIHRNTDAEQQSLGVVAAFSNRFCQDTLWFSVLSTSVECRTWAVAEDAVDVFELEPLKRSHEALVEMLAAEADGVDRVLNIYIIYFYI